ncbi:FtsX-like permease family protein [Anaerolinea sp.]|uniref:FtsX-like permease family protein n=1 Tax=Anaerolinea sp. TaxID=1872519 RepID=UPI002ACD36FA|nr:FtsX-like permease family protein [Anaerolinea sp.]
MNLYLTLALRYLNGRKLRTALTTLAIVFGVMVIFGMNTFMPTFVKTFQTQAMAAAAQVDLTITQKTGEAFEPAVLDKVREVNGVKVATGALERLINLPANYVDNDPQTPDRITAVILKGIVPQESRQMIAYNIVEGRFLEESDTNAAVITRSLAREFGVKLGDTLSLPTAIGLSDLAIVGILPEQVLPGNEVVLVPLAEAQRLTNMPDKINVVDANLDSMDKARRNEIQQNVLKAIGDTYKIGALEAGSEILTNIRNAQSIFNLMGFLALVMGGFIIFNTFRTIIAERRRDIGMLRALGASRSAIRWIILTEGLVQGVIGTALGLIFGYLFGAFTLNLTTPMWQQYLNLNVSSPEISPSLVLTSIILGVGITILSGLIPANSATRIPPLEALRPSLGSVSFKRIAGVSFWTGVVLLAIAVGLLFTGSMQFISFGAMLFVGAIILMAPALVNPISVMFATLLTLLFARDGTAHLAEGNLSRQPGRATVTASTTMIALAVVVMMAAVLSSVSLTFTRIMEKSLGSDYLIMPPTLAVWGSNTGAAPNLAEELRQVPEVAVVSTLRFAATQIKDISVGILGIEPGTYRQLDLLSFAEGDPDVAYRAMENERAMIINGVLGAAAGIQPGDEVEILTPMGKQTYHVVALATDYLNAKTTTAYISQRFIEEDFGRHEDIFFHVNLAPNADRQAVESAFTGILKNYPQFKLVDGKKYVKENARLFDAVFLGMYVMAAFLAIPSLIAMVNTLAIGVIERTREIGMLRAVGAIRRQVRRMILSEALILSAIGTAFGILAGLYMGYMAVKAFEAMGFPMEYIFPGSGILIAIAVGILFGALAAIVPARQAAQLDVVEALRYE